jgi:hypothetical protein
MKIVRRMQDLRAERLYPVMRRLERPGRRIAALREVALRDMEHDRFHNASSVER